MASVIFKSLHVVLSIMVDQLGVVVYTCHPNMWEAEAGGLQA